MDDWPCCYRASHLDGPAGIVCVWQHLRWYAAVAFLPVLFRGFAWFVKEPEPLAIQALGKRKLVYACMFGVLLVLGMQLP
jgi:hypothetical protein